MNKNNMLNGRLKSFEHAVTGIRTILTSQPNARIHAAATVAVVLAGFYFKITTTHWCLVILAILVVWIAEGLNTGLEFLADAASPDHHPLVKKAKDAAAAAVLIAACGAAVIGVLVFGPFLIQL